MKKSLNVDTLKIEEIAYCFQSGEKTSEKNCFLYGDKQGLGLEKVAQISAIIISAILVIADSLEVMDVSRGDLFFIGVPISILVMSLWLLLRKNDEVGYMLNQTERGLYVIPVYEEAKRKYTDIDLCSFLLPSDMKDIIIKRKNVDECVVKIKLTDKERLNFRVIYNKETKENLESFADFYGCDISW